MQHLIDSMGGIAAFGVFSICLFVVVFTGSMALAACLKKPFLDKMGSLPLQEESTANQTDRKSYE